VLPACLCVDVCVAALFEELAALFALFEDLAALFALFEERPGLTRKVWRKGRCRQAEREDERQTEATRKQKKKTGKHQPSGQKHFNFSSEENQFSFPPIFTLPLSIRITFLFQKYPHPHT